MTPPKVTHEIRLGEIVTVVCLIFALGGGAAMIRARDDAHSREVAELKAYEAKQDANMDKIAAILQGVIDQQVTLAKWQAIREDREGRGQ